MSAGWRWRASRSLRRLEEAVDVGRVECGGSITPASGYPRPALRALPSFRERLYAPREPLRVLSVPGSTAENAKELAQTEQVARQHGSAIAIGHPHDATLAALKSWLPQIEGKELALVPVSAVVRRRMAEEADPQH